MSTPTLGITSYQYMMESSGRFKGVPEIIYGTAFKFENTASLVEAALKAGFRAIDTAANKPQYRESLVGEGIAAVVNSGAVHRSDLFIQTKFSPTKTGRDPALYSYDTTKSIPEQVEESVSMSLASLGVTYIDSLVLHSLYPNMEDTLTAWRAMEALVPSKVSSLGLSNVDLDSLRQIYDVAKVKPSTIQNRFTEDTAPKPDSNLPPGLPYPNVPYDRDIREYSKTKGITYVPWGLLWGNPAIFDEDLEQILDKTAQEIEISKQVAFYMCMRSLGGCNMSILCGTTKEEKMQEALVGSDKLRRYLQESEGHKTWQMCVDHIRSIVDIN